MVWDHYFVGHGAQHSAEIMRLLPYMIFGAQEGVFTRTDCEVRALATPGGAVQVMPGAAVIANRTPGYAMQMYLARLAAAETVTVTPTDSSGARSDLVVIRVEDPLPGTGWQLPADPATGRYIYTRVIEGVPATTTTATQLGTSDSMYALARIDIPASTATITQDMIVPLRAVSNPLTGVGGTFEKQWTGTAVGPTTAQRLRTADTTFRAFPSSAVWQVPIPPWATEVDVSAMANPYMEGSAWGYARVTIAGNNPPSTWIDDNKYSGSGQGGQRTTVIVAGTQQIPPNVRGTVQPVKLEMRIEEASDISSLLADAGTSVHITLNFKQKPTAA